MKLAILHHHLEGGGVTQVLADHLAGLDLVATRGVPKDIALCHGGRDGAWAASAPREFERLTVQLHRIEGLDYDDTSPDPPSAVGLATRIADSLGQLGFQADDTLVHVHNHALGKTAALPGALALLADWGYRLLLQVHDFAEDFRPANYLHLATVAGRDQGEPLDDVLYPQAPHIHYAVLNRRDQDILHRAGVPTDRLHLLPNAVAEPPDAPDRDWARMDLARRGIVSRRGKLLLYPVRGIRRKNLGEALLWTALWADSVQLGVTLSPCDPVERVVYDEWRACAARLRLPVSFGIGSDAGIPLAQSLAACDGALTTSVAEGFGFAFAQPNLAGRPLVGRDLREITADFRASGVAFPGLGGQVKVPVRWLGSSRIVGMYHDAYNSVLACYGRAPVTLRTMREMSDVKLGSGYVDFADLDASGQQHVLGRVTHSRHDRSVLADANPWMRAALDNVGDGDEVPANAARIRTHYSTAELGRRLFDVYAALTASSSFAPLETLDGEGGVLDRFLAFERFRPVLA